MPLYKFSQNDLFHNRVETRPQCHFFIYAGSIYYNNRPQLSGAYTSSVPNVPSGHVSLYEMNVDRVSGSLGDSAAVAGGVPDIAYAFLEKDSSYMDFRRPHYVPFDAGDPRLQLAISQEPPDGEILTLTSSYPMSASISKEYFHANHVAASTTAIIRAIDIGTGVVDDPPDLVTEQIIRPSYHPAHPHSRNYEPEGSVIDDIVAAHGLTPKTTLGSKINALKNTLNSYVHLSTHYTYSSASLPLTGASDTETGDHSWPPATNTIVDWDKSKQEVGLLSVPSIFYGRQIQKGTVSLKFYITGTLVGELQDKNNNGELIQVGPTGSVNSGSVAGVVLYNEGFMLLTGSWDLTANPVAAAAKLDFTGSPANNDTITLVDAGGTEKTFKFNTGNTTVDGSLHSDGTSVNVGISGNLDAGSGAGLKFKTVVEVLQSAGTLKIDPAQSSGEITLTQDTAGTAGNTDITIVSSVITGPTPSKFANGMDGAFRPPHTERYFGATATSPRWIDFAQTIATGSFSSDGKSYSANLMPSSSFEVNFKGTNYVPTMTMLAHARKGHLNFSNNSTYIKSGQQTTPASSSLKFEERKELQIKNIVSSSYDDFTASYKRQTYISKIGIYDEKRNLIGIAKVATPVKKTEERDFTFKLKLDF